LTAEAPAKACVTIFGYTFCYLYLLVYGRDATTGLASTATPAASKLSEALAMGSERYAFVFNTAYW
jgi:hypothetical protein